jgi:hypothetical protein
VRKLLSAGLLTALGAALAPLQGQVTPTNAHWSLKGLRSGLCVEFLVSPAAAEDALDGRFTPTPVEALAARFPVLSREAASDPSHAGWIPSRLCWFAFDSAFTKGRKVKVDGGRTPVVVGYVGISALLGSDTTAMVGASIFTNAGPLASVASDARLKVDDIDYAFGLIPDFETSPDERRHELRHGKLTVQWDGRASSARPAEMHDVHLTVRSSGMGLFAVTAPITPDSAFVAAGNLRVFGTGKLVGMIGASPIRQMSSYLKGGDVEWDFSR